MALEMAESISTELPTHFFHLLPGVEGGELQWEMVGLTEGKGPTAWPGWGLQTQSQPVL